MLDVDTACAVSDCRCVFERQTVNEGQQEVGGEAVTGPDVVDTLHGRHISADEDFSVFIQVVCIDDRTLVSGRDDCTAFKQVKRGSWSLVFCVTLQDRSIVVVRRLLGIGHTWNIFFVAKANDKTKCRLIKKALVVVRDQYPIEPHRLDGLHC